MAKVKVKVKSGKPSGSGTLIARVPVSVAKTDQPKGPKIYGSTVRIAPHIKTNSRGKPRRH